MRKRASALGSARSLEVLTGLRPEPTFLIPKPFKHETVKAVISQALFFDMKAKHKSKKVVAAG